MRLLIVEDEKEIRRFLKASLQAEMFSVDVAEDGEQGLYLAKVNDYDLIILDNILPKKLREIFWHKTILGVCKDILRHVEFAKKDLENSSLIKEPGVFAGMLAAIERSADKALKEREETMKFLKTYNR